MYLISQNSLTQCFNKKQAVYLLNAIKQSNVKRKMPSVDNLRNLTVCVGRNLHGINHNLILIISVRYINKVMFCLR